MKKQFLTLITIGTLVLSACGGGAAGTNESSTDSNAVATTPTSQSLAGSSTTEDEESNFLADKKGLQQAEAALRALPKFKDKAIKVFQNIHFYGDGRIMLSLQDPANPENIDEYKFSNGTWAEPQAVQISGGGDLAHNTFALDSLKFETVASIYNFLAEKNKTIEGGEIDSHIYYNFNVMNQSGQWFSGIQATRGKYSGYFNADGTLKEFNKD